MELLFHSLNRMPLLDTTRCSHCQKRMKTVMAENGRTDFRRLHCDLVGPIKTAAVKSTQGPLAAPAAD
jgi:hypothetical protein